MRHKRETSACADASPGTFDSDVDGPTDLPMSDISPACSAAAKLASGRIVCKK
jgi:hypothetical protein